jgi:hypothetical protein
MRTLLVLLTVRLAAPLAFAPPRWEFDRSTMKTIVVPEAVRHLATFGDLEYDDTSRVRGMLVDLNHDGKLDYIIQSAESLCGNGGCDYLIVDGATKRDAGSVFGGAIYVDAGERGFPTLHALAHMSADASIFTEYVFKNKQYSAKAARMFARQELDSLTRALKRVPKGPPK